MNKTELFMKKGCQITLVMKRVNTFVYLYFSGKTAEMNMKERTNYVFKKLK
jgi:hypothetical protein